MGVGWVFPGRDSKKNAKAQSRCARTGARGGLQLPGTLRRFFGKQKKEKIWGKFRSGRRSHRPGAIKPFAGLAGPRPNRRHRMLGHISGPNHIQQDLLKEQAQGRRRIETGVLDAAAALPVRTLAYTAGNGLMPRRLHIRPLCRGMSKSIFWGRRMEWRSIRTTRWAFWSGHAIQGPWGNGVRDASR